MIQIEFEETPQSQQRKLASILTETPRTEIVTGMGWDDYCAAVALNPSSIVHCDKSELHVRFALEGDEKDSPSLQKGRALHSALLTPFLFASAYEPADTRRTAKVVEAARERGVELLLPQDFEVIVQTALRASQNKDLQRFIKKGQAEVSLFTSEHGCQCKGRLDWISADPLAILDVKTAREIDERNFSHAFYRYFYDTKLGLYQRWLQRLMNVDSIPVYLLLVENSGPWDCAVVPRCVGEPIPLPEAVLQRGAAKGLGWIERIKRCIETGEWPGIDAEPDWNLMTPTWEMSDEDIEGAEVME